MSNQAAHVIGFPPGTEQPIPVATDDVYSNPAAQSPALPVSLKLASPEFKRAFRFGVIDNAVLVSSTLAGLSLDDYIADAIGVPGYGALVGATVGNAISDGLAGIPEGRSAALGYLGGALLPAVPIAVAMLMKKEPTGMTKNLLVGASVALFVLAFIRKNERS
jgi:hypothetical protein